MGWDDTNGWIGEPLPWKQRGLWCKVGLHRWGAPWCMECGAPDHILQEAIREQFRRLIEKQGSNDAK